MSINNIRAQATGVFQEWTTALEFLIISKSRSVDVTTLLLYHRNILLKCLLQYYIVSSFLKEQSVLRTDCANMYDILLCLSVH